ncbi:MAG: DUF262 domain-containing protein [Lachnospiraceae bacterium]
MFGILNKNLFYLIQFLKTFLFLLFFWNKKIDSDTGITNYDVIDGKQRLSTIIGFINNEIPLPKEFGNDIYGNNIINGLSFNEIKKIAKEDDEIKTLVSDFWAYSISVEYIENPDYKIVDSIFDRLNREGSRLNAQELRKAQYYDTLLYNDIISYRNDEYMTKLTYKLNKNRMEDVGFITELYIMTVENTIFDGNENEIDKVFADIVDKYDEECSISVRMKFEKNINLLKEWNIDYSAYNIEGVSHLYALWYLALYISNNQINADDICDKMNIFYRNLRSDKTIPQTVIYQQSMQSASRSKSARKKRVNAILTYLEYEKL